MKYKRKGNLFQKKTKAKSLSYLNAARTSQALINCGSYIHSNPIVAGLVKNSFDWEFSSLPDYAGIRNGILCNKKLYLELTGLRKIDFYIPVELSDEEIEDLF